MKNYEVREKVLRLTVRLYDPATIARVKRYLRAQCAVGVSKNAAAAQALVTGIKKDGQLDRMEHKLDDILNMQFIVADLPTVGADEIETNIDDQFAQFV